MTSNINIIFLKNSPFGGVRVKAVVHLVAEGGAVVARVDQLPR